MQYNFLVNCSFPLVLNTQLYLSRLRNKGVYFKSGLRNMAKSSNSNLEDKIEVEVILWRCSLVTSLIIRMATNVKISAFCIY